MILICRLYEQKGILWNFMFEHIHLFDSPYMYIYSCLYTHLLDLYNLWVNDDIDREFLSLSVFLIPFFFFFFLSLRCLCIIRDGSTSDDDSNSLYLTFIRIVTSTTNNFLRLFFSENDTYPFLTDTHSHRRLISLYSKKQSGERKGKQCAHMPIRIVRIKRRRSDRV
jgi:hypothetical protein